MNKPTETTQQVWLADITRTQGKHLVVLFDSDTQTLIGTYLTSAEPTPEFICESIKSALTQHGAPRTLISDRSVCFLDQQVGEVLADANVEHKFLSNLNPALAGKMERVLAMNRKAVE